MARTQVREVVRPDGLFVVCDHVPPPGSARLSALHSTPSEQHAALASAGFERIATNLVLNGLYVCSGTAPSLRDWGLTEARDPLRRVVELVPGATHDVRPQRGVGTCMTLAIPRKQRAK
jgi:hypothetical protein